MKRTLALLLAVGMLLSMGSGLALAQETEPKISVDGVKDDAYNNWKMIDHSYWNFYEENGTAADPWYLERVKNTLWFDVDEQHIYLYFQAESLDVLYQPKEDEPTPPTNDTFYERVTVCLDTAPSSPYNTHCFLPHNAIPEEDECDHFCCNAISGEGASHRLMATFVPAWNILDANFSTEEWEGVSFIDYNTNTYGFELKYPRVTNESYFQLNIVNYVNDKDDWPESAPETGYIQSFCADPQTNHKDMVEIYYDEFPGPPTPQDYEIVQPIIDLLETIPSLVTLEHKAFLEECRKRINQFNYTQKQLITNLEKLQEAESQIAILEVEQLLDQLPKEFTQENKYLVDEVLHTYRALTQEQKERVANKDVLYAAMYEKDVLDIIAFTDDLPEIITKQDCDAIAAMWNKCFGLPKAYEAKVTNAKALKSADAKVKYVRAAVYGDVDNNGSVDAKDALGVLRYSVGSQWIPYEQEFAAEVDRKQGINAKDALEILKYTVGKIQEFPVEIIH